MPQLLEVDALEVAVLVDNVTDNLSSAPRFVETELAAMTRRHAVRPPTGASSVESQGEDGQ